MLKFLSYINKHNLIRDRYMVMLEISNAKGQNKFMSEIITLRQYWNTYLKHSNKHKNGLFIK